MTFYGRLEIEFAGPIFQDLSLLRQTESSNGKYLQSQIRLEIIINHNSVRSGKGPTRC